VLALSAPTSAFAGVTYCTYAPSGCPAGAANEATVKAAVEASDALGGNNTILVGAGSHSDSFSQAGASTLNIIGSGESSTTLIGGADVIRNNSSISNLTITVTGGNGFALSLFSSSASDIAVNGTSGNKLGIAMFSPASVTNANIEMTQPEDDAVEVESTAASASATIDDSTIVGSRHGVRDGGHALSLERDVINAPAPLRDVNDEGTATRVDDSLLESTGGVGIEAVAQANLFLDHDTIVGTVGGAKTGILALAGSTAAGVSVTMRDTIIDPNSVTSSIEAMTSGSPLEIATSYSDYNPATEVGPSLITPAGTNNNIDFSPLFASGASEDAPAPYALQAGSHLIDKGTPGGLLEGELSSTDLAGNPRALIGGSTCGPARTDIGAYEYSPPTIALTATAAAGAVAGSTAAAFSATACDPDPAQTPTITWSFDDGAAAGGANVSHMFATAGTHTATAHVSDAAGRSASATVSFAVEPLLITPVKGKVAFPKRTIAVSRAARLTLPLSCPHLNTAAACVGHVALTERVLRSSGRGSHRRRRRVTVTLVSVSFSIPSGSTKGVALKLSKQSFKALVAARKLHLTATAVATPGPATATVALALSAPSKPRRARG
jgi:hypothetical protein